MGPEKLIKMTTGRLRRRLNGPDSANATTHPERQPYLLSAAARVAARLEQAGIGPDRHRIF